MPRAGTPHHVRAGGTLVEPSTPELNQAAFAVATEALMALPAGTAMMYHIGITDQGACARMHGVLRVVQCAMMAKPGAEQQSACQPVRLAFI